MISFQTKITLEDYLNFNLHIFKQRSSFKFLRVLSYFFIFMSLFSVFYSWYTGEDMDWSSFGMIAFAFFYLFGLPFLLKLNAKKAYNSNKMMQEPIHFEINDEAVLMNAESYQTNMTWDKVFKVVEDNHGLYIFQSKQAANLIPKRDLSEQQLNDVRTIIRSKKGFSRKLKG